MIRLSIYPRAVLKNTRDRKGAVVSLEAVVNRIRTGDKGLAKHTRTLRQHLANDRSDAYDKEKPLILPAATFSGIFSTRNSKVDLAKKFTEHTGQVTIDVDDIEPHDIPVLIHQLKQHPNVVLCFQSPSGTGLKIVCRVTPTPSTETDSEHKHAWRICTALFDELLTGYGYACDSGDDPTRLCFLAHDPTVIYNPDAVPIQWDRDAYHLQQQQAEQEAQERTELAKRKSDRSTLEARNWDTGEIDKTALDYINPDSLHYDDWLRIIIACKTAGVTWHEADAWSRRGTKHREGDIEKRWDGLRTGEVNWGTAVYFAQQHGYELPEQEQKRRYTRNRQHKHRTSDMDTERDANRDQITQWLQETEQAKGKHLLILGSAAGTGKTTASTTIADTFLYIAKTTDEADSVFQALDQQEQDCHRHRPRLYNRDNENWERLPLGLGANQRPCIRPELCNLHAQRIGTPNAICARCPLYGDCKENGYLSQAETECKVSKVVYAWNEAVACDEIYKARVTQICTKNDILIVDEVNPLLLTQARTLDRDTLYDVAERFRHPHDDTIADYRQLKALLDLTATAETPGDFITGLQDWIQGIENITALDKKLSRYPVGLEIRETPPDAPHNQPFEARIGYQNQEVSVPVVDHETADDTPVYYIAPDTPIETGIYQMRFMPYTFLLKVGLATLDAPPQRHTTLIRDLKTFFDENPDTERAPFTFSAEKQRFDFHLKPTLNHRRVIFNTASDPDNLISEAYRGQDIHITRHTGTPPAWKDPLVFQLSTGNYLPRHSLLGQDKDTKTLHLKPRAQDLIDGYIIPSIEAGLKVLIVAPKAFQDIDAVRALDCEVINHHHAEGRNDYQDYDIVFIFHYEPDHNTLQTQAKHIFSNAETPLDFTREKRTVTQGSVSFEKNTYTDARVQAVYNRECNARLHQSGMRLRPNINTGKVIVFLTAEPIDIPATPTAFKPTDAKLFTGDWREFRETLKAIDTAQANGDTKAYQQATGQSERTAQRKTQQAKAQRKAERDADIVRRAETETHAQIAKRWNVSEKTIQRILKQHREKLKQLDINDKTLLYNTNSDLAEMSTCKENAPDRAEQFVMDVLNLTHTEACALLDLPVSDPRSAELRKHIKRPNWHDWCKSLKLPTADDWEDDIYRRYRDGDSPAEIADAVQITEAQVKVLLDTQAF